TGGAMGGAGELVLSTARMTRVLEISPADQLAVVEPGVINADLNAQLAPHGLFFAPDPASRAISTIGGNIATNAGGLLCAKYGVTREAVLGLKVVLADGTLLGLGHRTVKGVTGLDLTALMIGSEGTLGVVVEATLTLVPLPTGSPATIGAYFPSVVAAAAASAAITAERLRPAAMELIDELEPERRGIYAGAIACMSFGGSLDSCIAIRTIVLRDDLAQLQAGAGIVFDSVPDREYEESLQKSAALKRAIALA
ncbi:MAG: FAD-binding protein, partial [Gammaproteobacteria bacterium]